MTLGVVGTKCGMTQIFSEGGESIQVTVIEIKPNRIVQVKTIENDGYQAIQVTKGAKRPSKITKSLAGHFVKAGVDAGDGLWEFRLNANEAEKLAVGTEVKVDIFKVGQMVDVSGVSKGKGFAGVMKRHNFSGQPASHGNSLSHRHPGSIGQRQTPGRVFKGRKMAGHMGADNCTVQSQEIVRIDAERNLLLIRGAIPGAPGGNVFVFPAVKVRGDGNGA